ncbi:hypothetical protein HPB50_017588 [Hyalomma asiaticum]|uniref:Uncharacterized protein n=1 Tax=Hyalomma asiaticum TaxID=266040 RepID=A0ACB7SQY4_HYAAI|nr:hypothetical protein HPB50_017588 [Hyalomma asiaticum]
MRTPLTNHRFPFRRPNPGAPRIPRCRRCLAVDCESRARRQQAMPPSSFCCSHGPGVPTLFTGAGPCAGLIDLPFFFRFFGLVAVEKQRVPSLLAPTPQLLDTPGRLRHHW